MRKVTIVVGVLVFGFGVLATSLMTTRRVGAQNAGNGGEKTSLSPAVALGAPTRGVVFKTAAINFDGSLASCFGCTGSHHIATGAYEVDFDHNVQATNGWSRWVQVDTLQIFAINNKACSTADRFGNTSGVYVQCYDGSGTLADSSFFLFVAR